MGTLTSLYLAPCDLAAAPTYDSVLAVLQTLQVVASEIGQRTFAAGVGFSQHVIFAGCSPLLVMRPPQDGGLAFCHVAIHGPLPKPALITGPNSVAPRCPACRTRFGTWHDDLDAWQENAGSAICPGCHRRWSAEQLDWRQHAIAGRTLIELRNVFPGEASPSDTLLAACKDATTSDWTYAWAGYCPTE